MGTQENRETEREKTEQKTVGKHKNKPPDLIKVRGL